MLFPTMQNARVQWKAAHVEEQAYGDGFLLDSDLTAFWLYMKIQQHGEPQAVTPTLIGRWIEQMERFSREQVRLALDEFYKE